MKTSKLKKDKVVSVRINKDVKDLLKKDCITVQKIVDDYIDLYFEVNIGGKDEEETN